MKKKHNGVTMEEGSSARREVRLPRRLKNGVPLALRQANLPQSSDKNIADSQLHTHRSLLVSRSPMSICAIADAYVVSHDGSSDPQSEEGSWIHFQYVTSRQPAARICT